MKRLKIVTRWGLYVLLVVSLFFLVDGVWTLYLQNQIAPQIREHLAEVNLSGTGGDTTAFHRNLSQVVAGKKIIGFGEATHGTAEFEQAFSLISKKLIREQGFNVVVFAEMNFADTWDINRYVTDEAEGRGLRTPHAAFAFMQEDRLKLIEWVQAYNKDKSPVEKVWFMGADVNSPNESARNALLYCENNNIKLPLETHEALVTIVQLPLYSAAQSLRVSGSLEAVQAKVRPLYNLVRNNSAGHEGVDLRQSWMVQSIYNLDQALKSYYASSHRVDSFRDSTMYHNLEWVLERRPTAKLLVFAHNVHIEKKVGFRAMSPDIARLGWHISQKYPDQFAVIATEAWSGKYVYSAKGEEAKIVEKMSKIGTTIARATQAPEGLLNLNATPALTQFFNRGHTATVGIASPASMFSRTTDFAEAFDALFYVRVSSPVKLRKLYSFNLKLPLDAKQLNKQHISLSCTTSYSNLIPFQPRNGVELEISFLDENQSILGQSSHPMSSSGTFSKNISAPEGTASVLISFNGSKVKDFVLSRFVINGKPLDPQYFVLEGERYKKTLCEGESVCVNLESE